MDTRLILYLFFCIPSRLLLAYLCKIIDQQYLFYLGIIIGIMGIGMGYLYFTKGRMNAVEGGGNTWWAEYRLFHASLFLGSAFYLLNESRNGYFPLLLDTIGSLFIYFHERI